MAPRAKGTIDRQDDLLSLSFGWHKQKFETVKRLEGTFYEKESKTWKVPLKHLPTLEKSRYFSDASFDYLFDRTAARDDVANTRNQKAEARAQVKANPFFVTQEVLEKAEADLAVMLSSSGVGIEFTLRSRAKALLSNVEGAHLLGDSDRYFLPVLQLRPLLNQAKEQKFLFGVEKQAGESLQQSASLRNQVQLGYAATVSELEASHLIPIVSVSINSTGVNSFNLLHLSTQQLKDCLPGNRSLEERKRRSRNLTMPELMEVFQAVHTKSTKLWLSKEALLLLRTKQELFLKELLSDKFSFDSSLLSLVQPNIFWHRNYAGHAGLYWRRQHLQDHIDSPELAILKCRTAQAVLHFPEFFFFEAQESELLAFYRAIKQDVGGLYQIPCSSEFCSLLADLENRERLLARLNLYHSLTDCDADCINKTLEARLFPHQRIAVRWLKESTIALLGDDMGLGKTLSVLAAYSDLHTRKELDFALIVCPNSLTANWLREARNWLPELNLATLPRQKKERERFLGSLESGSMLFLDALVINYEALRLDYVHPAIGKFLQTRKSLIVLDESQRAKNSQSKTFLALAELCSSAPKRFLLSGTPTPKELSDIWSQIYLLDQGERFGTNYYKWLEAVADIGNKWSDYAVNSYKPVESKEAIKRVHELLLRRKKEDVVSLPEKLFSVRDVELSGDQLKRYEQVRKDLLCTVASHEGEEFVREIQSILEEYLRAVQVASNPRLVDPSWIGTPAKFEELDEIVQEIVKENEQSLVIWTNYLLNVRELVERYKDHGAAAFSGEVKPEARAQAVSDFQERKIRILVAVPAAGGVGITLTAAQTAVYLDKTWNGEHWMQSIDRLHRIGQRGTVHIISLQSSKVDDLISRNLEKKRKMQEQLLSREGNVETVEAPTREDLLAALG